MKKLAWICGSLGILALTLMTASACGPMDEATGDECQTSAECPGQLCWTEGAPNLCVDNCTGMTDSCASGETCMAIGQTADGGTQSGCIPNDAQTDQPDAGGMGDAGMDECTENSDCPGENNICNTTANPNQCESTETEPEYKFIQIKDTSNNSCDADDPGADVFGVELVGSDGSTIGWGTVSVDGSTVGATNLTGMNNTHKNYSTVFTGNAPAFDDEEADRSAVCPAPENGTKHRPDSLVALGCGGAMVLGIKADSGLANIEAGQNLHVYEYGNQCCTDCGETLSVSICSAQTSNDFQGAGTDADGNFPTCGSNTLMSGASHSVATIEESHLPEVSSGN